MAGYFITFEGIDFCGKSLQAKKIFKKIKSLQKPVVLLRDPGTTSISENIRSILLNAQNKKMCAATELLLFAAARAQMMSESIIPALESGKNRYL